MATSRRRIWLRRLAVSAAVLALLGFVALEIVRFVAGRAGVQAVDLPPGSQIEQLAVGADYTDAYRVPLGCRGLELRTLMPVTAEREAARTPSEVVYRGTAPGLYYYASYVLEPPDEPTAFVLSTAVFYESTLGAIYFTPVKHVHRRVVPLAVSRQATNWCRTPE